MTLRTLVLWAAPLSVVLWLPVACGGFEGSVPEATVASDASVADARVADAPVDGRAASDASRVAVCIARCDSDGECAATCPAGGGPSCCDLATNTCYRAQSACPAAAEDDAGLANPY